MPPQQEQLDIDPAALARAEAALNALSDRYLAWAAADLARLETCLTEVLTGPDDHRPDHLDRLFGIAHDMKGQGATFDYPLVSEIGNRLCRLLKDAPQPHAAAMDRVKALVAAMGRVIRERLTGDGGEAGHRLLETLL